MHPEFPDDDTTDLTEWWAPLEAVAADLPAGKPYEFFELADFMLMCRIPRPGDGPLFEYKHRYTRYHLVLDRRCQPYGYVPGLSRSTEGRYVRLPSIQMALDGLRLDELPWMKPGLEHERIGPSPFDDVGLGEGER